MDSTTLLASATLVLSFIIYLNERTNRKITTIEKKLERFYIPLQQNFIKLKGETNGEKIKEITSQQDFMKHIYLCQNQHLIDLLNKFFDKQSNIEPYLGSIAFWADKDIKKLKSELNILRGDGKSLMQKIRGKLSKTYGRGGRRP